MRIEIISDRDYGFLVDSSLGDIKQIAKNSVELVEIVNHFLAQNKSCSSSVVYVLDVGIETFEGLAGLWGQKDACGVDGLYDSLSRLCKIILDGSISSRIIVIERALCRSFSFRLFEDELSQIHNPLLSNTSWEYWKRVHNELVDGTFIETLDLSSCYGTTIEKNEVLSWLRTDSLVNYRNYQSIYEKILACYKLMSARPYKLVALDLDNTLWHGTVREDGIEGIEVGGVTVPGKFFYYFQEVWKYLKERGILLAIVSKNKLSDIKQAFKVHKMPLSMDDFVEISCTDAPKSFELREMAASLNLNYTDFLFLDDTEHEREEVRETLGGITVLDLGQNPLTWISDLMADDRFVKTLMSVSKNYKPDRTENYRNRKRRLADKQSNQQSLDFSSWLTSLKQKIEPIHQVVPSNRAYDLFGRVNQFNARGESLSKSKVDLLLRTGIRMVEFDVVDKFSADGVVGAVGYYVNSDEMLITDFLLSCRVFGRRIEDSMLDYMYRLAISEGYKRVRVEFNVGSKNKASSEFFSKVTHEGFFIEGSIVLPKELQIRL